MVSLKSFSTLAIHSCLVVVVQKVKKQLFPLLAYKEK